MPRGYAGNDSIGGVRAAAAWRLHKTYKTYKTYKIMIGAPLYTPWVCMPLSGLARVMICRREVQATHPTAKKAFFAKLFFCRELPTGKSVRDF